MKKIVSILVMVMVVMFSACSSKPETPEEIAVAYIEACLKGNLDEANSYWSKRTDKSWKESSYNLINTYNEDVEDISKFTYKTKRFIEKKNSIYIDIFMFNKTSKNELFRKYGKEDSPSVSIKFVFENGEWKIDVI